MTVRNRDSCHPLFKQLNILPLYSQYIFSLSAFAVKNTDTFQKISAVYSINTRQGFASHPPTIICQTHKKQCITLELKFSIINHSTLSNYHTIQTYLIGLDFKFLLAGSFYSWNEFFE